MNHPNTADWSILYIDDDEDDYILVRDMLSVTRGHKVHLTWARTYEEGEIRLAAGEYDAILVDYDLGSRTGIDLVRAFSPLHHSPFILYTGRGSYEVDLEAMQAGAALYMTKGEFNSLTLERFIRYAIERKKADDASRLNERKFSLLFEKAAYPIALSRYRDGLIIDANQAFLELLGFTRAEIIGRTSQEIQLISSMETRQAILAQLQSTGSVRDLEMVLRTRSGDARTVSLNFDILEIDAEKYLLNIIRDVTESRRAEEELRKAHQQAVWLARFPDENPNPVARVSLDGTVLYHNRASDSVWGLHSGEKIPSYFNSLLEEVYQHSRQLDRDITIDGRYYSITLMPFPSDGYVNLYGKDNTEIWQAEQALRESEDRFANAFEASPNAMVISRIEDGLIENINTAFEQLFDYPRQEVIGKTSVELHMFFRPSDREAVTQRLKQDGHLRDSEVDIRTRTGIVRRVSLSSAIIQLKGKPAIVTVINDMTEQMLAEASQKNASIDLVNERNRLKAVLEALPVGTCILDRQGGVLEKNTVYDEIWGGPVPHTDSVNDYEAFRAWWVETGKPIQPEEWASAQAVQKGLTVTDQFLEIQRFDGRRAYILNSGAPIFDFGGQVTGSVVAIMDVTRMVETQSALDASRDRLRVVLQSVPLMVYTCDRDLRYTSIYQPMGGFKEEDVLGRRDDEILPLESAAELTAAKQKALETGLGGLQEVRVPLNGEETYYLLTIDPIRDRQGMITGLTCAAIDITEQKKKELDQQEQAVRIEVQRRLLEQRELERSTLARDLHDGPIQDLASALFQIQSIRDDLQNADLQKAVDYIRDEIKGSVRELRDIMNDLRPPALLHFGFSRVAQYQVEEYRSRFPEVEIELDLVDDRDILDEQARLALFRIFQAGMNNIFHHSNASKIWVAFRVEDGLFCFELRDNGVGFEPTLGDTQLVDKGHFGLVGMRERAEAIGAKLWVTSQPAEGAAIRVVGPIRVDASGASDPS